MIRTPLRPLARILEARARGENPDSIERENLRLRHEQMRDQARLRAEGRLLVLAGMFIAAFATVGVRTGSLAIAEPAEPRATAATVPAITAQRADIVDRNGNILATNMATHSLYAQPRIMIDPERAAQGLAAIFPDLDADELHRKFTGDRTFLWIKRRISPEQMQQVHEIGDPGLLFGPREMRLYPNGALAAHVLGGASFGREGVRAAEVVGVAGVERTFDARLRDPAAGGAPLRLSLDLSVQSTVEQVLYGGMRLLNAKGAAAILMDVQTGEVVSLASLPDFDPNDRPAPVPGRDAGDSPLFNRAVQGVYELGSTFKALTVAQALEDGLVTPDTMIDTRGPLTWGKHKIRDFHDYGPRLSVTDVMVKSSNIGTARIAMEIGAERQRAFLDELGLLEPTPLEMAEAAGGRPLLPPNWSEISTMTISYGHGLSTTPMHLAAAYATIANGGRLVKPTLIAGGGAPGERVLSEETAAQVRSMLHAVVERGTASFARIEGYAVGGKTGTADKPNPQGGYYEDKVIATFAGLFPAEAPRYVIVVTLDEPEDRTGPEPRRTAGWTAVPVAAEIIRRTAPLLGIAPAIEQAPGFGVTLAAN
ncbi:peptidoglycan D,D-transpeptidase FtsI family protein [Rhodovulum adriaticum]|uniref:Cell division protein FtsI (Penicillin-binding protein 3) n=1 Tax=Rhodovulum adriaticum TaxID=35804 RepID=A0A4R2NXJ1_RHOAD|nr:penicillin-binding protein 2 [Rhodovulum adriaticum]MBK1636310.1 cell division protein FtsI [Rhodovulum adriaticum]TCP26311.1 cell division protein FtsI (penicillin-binding protein 3) [Rhodovulum adriaticum]